MCYIKNENVIYSFWIQFFDGWSPTPSFPTMIANKEIVYIPVAAYNPMFSVFWYLWPLKMTVVVYVAFMPQSLPTFNPKTAGGDGWGGGRGRSIWPLPVVFRKMYLLKRGWNTVFFVTFNIIIRHIFPENFIEIS